MKNLWQDKLRDRMEEHEEPAPDGLWEDIELLMSAGNSVTGMSAGLKIRLWGRRLGIVAAAAIILFVIGFYTWRGNNMVIPVEEPTYSVEQVEINQEKNLLAQETEVGETVQQVSYEKNKDVVIKDAIVEDKENNPVFSSENGEKDKDSSENNDEKSSVKRYESSNSDLESINRTESRLFKNERKRKSSKWQADVYASNISSGANYKHDGFGSLSPYGFPSEEDEFVLAAIRSDSPEDIEVNRYKYVYTDIKHSQPVMLGVSLKYNLDNNWSINSGLTYTILSSQLRSGNKNHYYESEQSLHYIGVPINVNYTVWQNNKISTYISAGGLVEKNVSGSLATDYFINNEIETSDKEKISVKQLQFSVNSAIGIQYQLSENIGLYSEPGVALHFKNNSDIETIYKEKPLNFNIRFGLRFTLND